jgi:hypothetical protein
MMPTLRNCSMRLSAIDGLRRLWVQAISRSKPNTRVFKLHWQKPGIMPAL